MNNSELHFQINITLYFDRQKEFLVDKSHGSLTVGKTYLSIIKYQLTPRAFFCTVDSKCTYKHGSYFHGRLFDIKHKENL